MRCDEISTVTHERRSLGEEYTLGEKRIALKKDMGVCPFFTDVPAVCGDHEEKGKSGEWETL